MPLQIIDENTDYFVINKPANLAVEPPSRSETLKDLLISSNQISEKDWTNDQRFGVVHRLDTDTSGIIVWAKTVQSQDRLKLLWQGRTVKKIYLALVEGDSNQSGKIEYSLIRDNRNDRQAVAWIGGPKSRPAITEYKKLRTGELNNKPVSLLEVHPITGRTHQIRVHLKAIGHPIIGDSLYGEKTGDTMAKAIGLNRQFLHAYKLEFEWDGQLKSYNSDLSIELQQALEKVGINW